MSPTAVTLLIIDAISHRRSPAKSLGPSPEYSDGDSKLTNIRYGVEICNTKVAILSTLTGCLYMFRSSDRPVGPTGLSDQSDEAFTRSDRRTDRSVRPRLRPTVCQTSQTDRSVRL